MTRFNQALVAAASSVALFGGALTLVTPAAQAQEFDIFEWSRRNQEMSQPVGTTQVRGRLGIDAVSETCYGSGAQRTCNYRRMY